MSYLARMSSRLAAPGAWRPGGLHPAIRSQSPIADVDQRVGSLEPALNAFAVSEEQAGVEGAGAAAVPIASVVMDPVADTGTEPEPRPGPILAALTRPSRPTRDAWQPAPGADETSHLRWPEAQSRPAEPGRVADESRPAPSLVPRADQRQIREQIQDRTDVVQPREPAPGPRGHIADDPDHRQDDAATPFASPQVQTWTASIGEGLEPDEAMPYLLPLPEAERQVVPPAAEPEAAGPSVIIDQLTVEVVPPREQAPARPRDTSHERTDSGASRARPRAPASLIGPLGRSVSPQIRFALRHR